MLNLIFSTAGRGKTEYAKRLAKAEIESGKNVIYFVAEQISFESERSILRSLSAEESEKIEVLTFRRFCEKFFTLFGERGKRCIDNSGRAVMMDAAIGEVYSQLKVFRTAAKKAAFSQKMLDLCEKMKRFAVKPENLISCSDFANGSFAQKLFESALIISEYNKQLQNEYYDPLDDITKAAKMLDEHNYFENKTVIFDSFNGFTAQQMGLIEKIIALCGDCYITLCFNGLYTNDSFSLFANVEKTANALKTAAKKHSVKVAADITINENIRFKNPNLDKLESNIYRYDSLQYDEKPEGIFVCEAKEPYEESDFVASQIRRLVRTKNYRYKDFAVITRDIKAYSGIIDNALSRYNIPCFIDSRKGVEGLGIFRFCYYLLAAAQNGFSTADIISALKTGITDINEDLLNELDNYTCIWKIDYSSWSKPFTGHPNGMNKQPDDESTAMLEALNALRNRIYEALCVLKNALKEGKAKNICTALYDTVLAFGGDKNIKQLANMLTENGDTDQAQAQIKSFDLFIGVLDQLVMAIGERQLSGEKFFEMYNFAVSACDLGTVPQAPDEVSVGSADRMRPNSPKVTFIIGAQSGQFPAVFADSSIFTVNELKTLNAHGAALPYYNESTAADERFLAYTAVASASEMLYLCYCTGGGEQPNVPSSIIEQTMQIFPAVSVLNCGEAIESTVENKDTAISMFAKHKKQNDAIAASIYEYFGEDDSAVKMTVDGIHLKYLPISPEISTRLFGKNLHLSASKTDTFFKCRFYYFCKYGLNLKKFRISELDNLERGSLVHYALEVILKKHKAQSLVERSETDIADEIYALFKDYTEKISAGREISARENYNLKKLSQTTATLVKCIALGLKNSSFEVEYTEFGIGGGNPQIKDMEIELKNGGKAYISGAIDRIDIYENEGKKYIRIIDYKTGPKDFALSDVLHGQNLQMLIYMMALKRTDSPQFGKDIIPCGILYQPSNIKTASSSSLVYESQAADAELLKETKAKGIVLNDDEVFELMEHGAKGIFTPVKCNKDGSLAKSVCNYTEEQFELLCAHIEELIKNMGAALHCGDIRVSPLSGTADACKYCDYNDICGNSEPPQVIEKTPDNKIYGLLNEKYGEKGDKNGQN